MFPSSGRLLTFVALLTMLLAGSFQQQAQAAVVQPSVRLVDSLRARLRQPLSDTARVHCYWLLARYLKNTSLDTARFYAERSIGLARRIGDRKGEAYAQRGLAAIFYLSGNYPATQRAYEAALRAARHVGLCRVASDAYMGMGLVADALGNVAGAVAYFEQARAVNATCRPANPHYELVLLTNLGNTYLQSGQLTKAERPLRQALALAGPGTPPPTLLNLLDLVGMLQLGQHHPDSAIATWERELALARTSHERRSEAYALGNLATARLQQHQPAAALTYAEQAMRLARQIGNQSQLTDFTLVKARALHAMQRPEAFDTLTYYTQLRDTLSGQARAKIVAQAQARFDLAENQARIRELEQQRRIAALEADRQTARTRLLTLVMGGLALLLAGGAFFYVRLQRSRTALAASEAEARAANATKDQLMSIIGHDLRGPVATVRQLLPLVLPAAGTTGALDQATRDQASGLLTAGVQQLESLLDNLLQWGRAQSGQLVSQPQPLPVELVLQQSTAPYATGAAFKGVALTVSAPAGLLVFADLDLLRTVLRNLVSNAVKFTPPGGRVQVEAWVEPETNNGLGARVRFGVRDTGRGLVPAHAARLLADEATSPAGKSTPGTAGEAGTGLGLPLSARLVRMLGGELQLTDPAPEGAGAHFTFALPLAA